MVRAWPHIPDLRAISNDAGGCKSSFSCLAQKFERTFPTAHEPRLLGHFGALRSLLPHPRGNAARNAISISSTAANLDLTGAPV